MSSYNVFLLKKTVFHHFHHQIKVDSEKRKNRRFLFYRRKQVF